MGKKEYAKNKDKKKSMGDQEVCSMLLTLLCKAVAFLEKLVCLPLKIPRARASAAHSKASTAADDISAHWYCSAVPIKTSQALKDIL